MNDDELTTESVGGFYIKFALFIAIICLLARGCVYMNHLECDASQFKWARLFAEATLDKIEK